MGATHRYLAAYIPIGAPPPAAPMTLMSSSQIVFVILMGITGIIILRSSQGR